MNAAWQTLVYYCLNKTFDNW